MLLGLPLPIFLPDMFKPLYVLFKPSLLYMYAHLTLTDRLLTSIEPTLDLSLKSYLDFFAFVHLVSWDIE